jgi:AraC-like DNA-binding protein
LRHFGAFLRHLLLAATPLERVFRLRRLDPARYDWVSAETWGQAVEVIRGQPIDMAVVDPLLGGEARAHEVAQIRHRFPSLPLMLYTELTPATAAVLLDLGRVGIQRVVFHRFEDAPGSLKSAIESELEGSVSQQVMRTLHRAIRDLPLQLRQGLEAMLHAPGEGLTVVALAQRAQMTRRSCERWFNRVGLPSPRVVMVLARLLYAHRLLLDPGYTVEDVALKLGYGKVKTLQMQLRAVFGNTAGELRVTLSPDDALTIIVNRYFPQLQAAS